MVTDAILEQTLRCLWAHCHPKHGDRAPMDVFNRLLAKNVKPHGWTPNSHFDIQPQQIASRRERWTIDDLASLPRSHAFTGGDDFGCPIIVAEYDGARRLLDGNHRINRWVLAPDTARRDVNIHTVAAAGRLIALPPVNIGA